MSRSTLATVVGFIVLTSLSGATFPRSVARTTLVSQSAIGELANDRSAVGAVSDDGMFVAFGSDADNLVPADVGGYSDVFRRNVMTGAVDLVSVDSFGVQADMVSEVCDMSSDGRYVVFSSKATNLVGNDTNGRIRDIYVRDMITGTTELVSRNTRGGQANDLSLAASISDDGRYVAFDSRANNLGDWSGISGLYHVYLRDRRLGTTMRIDTSPISLKGANGDAGKPVISDDGRYVAFESAASDLLPGGDGNGATDVFRWDRTTGDTVRVSVTGVATEGDDASFAPAISADGESVAFTSAATNFGGAPDPVTGFYKNVYVRRVAAQTTDVVSSPSDHPSISDDGRYVSFSSTVVVADIFVRDLIGHRTARVSVTETRADSNGDSFRSAITGDGVQVAFDSAATNLVPDLNNEVDVFIAPVVYAPSWPRPS